MICISIIADTTETALERMDRASLLADIIEVRLDYIRNPDIAKIMSSRQRPIIITVTPAHQNGRFAGTEQERCEMLLDAVRLGAEYIDINDGCPFMDELLARKGSTKAIVSYHNFTETPGTLPDIYDRLASSGGDIVKIATFAQKPGDNAAMLQLIQNASLPIIGICMGAFGTPTRLLAPLYGSYLTFACLEQGMESAPGQVPAAHMKDIYRLGDKRPGCKIYGLVGNPVDKSRGYLLFNRLFHVHDLNSIYLNLLVDDIEEFMSNMAPLLEGFSVTMPHKQTVMDCLDDIDPFAEKIGAVNTVVRRDGRLAGFNTDAAGVLEPLQKRLSVRDRRVTLLGAGGAARAAAVGIADAGGRLSILNRTASRAAGLAGELGCACGTLADFNPAATDILVNMTSVGMSPDVDRMPVQAEDLRDMLVFDGIYNPTETMLLREAAKNGCTVIPGLEMFVHQAAAQFLHWTGIKPDTGLMKELLQ